LRDTFEWLGRKLLEKIPKSADTHVRARYYKAKKFILYGGKDIPLSVNIETNSTCTRSCYYCPRPIKRDDVIDDATFYSSIDQLSHWGFKGMVSLHQFNEPLTDKRIFDFLGYAHEKLTASRLVLYTNGDLLTSPVLERLFSVGVSEVRASIHEPSTKEFVARLAELEKHYGGLVLSDFRDAHRQMPLGNRGGLLEIGAIENVRMCLIEKMVIRADGNVVLCCNDAHERCVLGNVKDEQLYEIWDKPYFRKLRQELREGILELPMCKKCGHSI